MYENTYLTIMFFSKGRIHNEINLRYKPFSGYYFISIMSSDQGTFNLVVDIDLRLWHGGGPKRKVTDLTNLDVTLNSIEDQIINFRYKY